MLAEKLKDSKRLKERSGRLRRKSTNPTKSWAAEQAMHVKLNDINAKAKQDPSYINRFSAQLTRADESGKTPDRQPHYPTVFIDDKGVLEIKPWKTIANDEHAAKEKREAGHSLDTQDPMEQANVRTLTPEERLDQDRKRFRLPDTVPEGEVNKYTQEGRCACYCCL